MNNYSKLTVRYLKQHRGRTLLTLIGIIVSIAMFTVIGSIYKSGINNEIESAKARSNFEFVFGDANKEQIKVLTANTEIKNGGIVKEEGLLKVESTVLTDSLKNIRIKSYDKAALKDVFEVEIIEGRYPEKSNEVVVDKKLFAVLKDKKIDKSIKGQLTTNQGEKLAKEYIIVGAYDSTLITNWAISSLDLKTSANTDDYGYFANLKQKHGKYDIASKIAKENKVKLNINTRLLYLLGEGPDKEKNNDMEVIFGIMAGFVVLCTVVVIYNSFNISVMERIKHFGILRSIGATKTQVRNLVFREAFIMSIIAIPLGILLGLAGAFVTFNIIMDGFLGAIKIHFYPEVMVAAAALGLITVFLSAFLPAKTASKVSPIDAIRGTVVVKGDKIKRKSGRWTKLVMGFEGQVAYKNIKRSRKRFYLTCLSLMISLIMFVFFSNFIDILFESTKIANGLLMVEGVFANNKKTDGLFLDDKLPKTLKSMEGVKEIFELNYSKVPYFIDKNKVNPKFVPSLKLNKTEVYKDKYIIKETQLLGYDRNTFELLKKQNNLKIDYEDFDKNNEVVIVNKAGGFSEDKKRFYDGFTAYKVGDEITVPVINEKYLDKADNSKLKEIANTGNTMTFKVVGVVDYEALSGSIMYDSYGVIMSNDCYHKLTNSNKLSLIAMNFTSPEYANKNYEKLSILADENKTTYIDIKAEKQKTDTMEQQFSILVYGFIGLILVISTVNIINTVTINLLVKKREYATFKAIGMTKGQFQKLVLLEGALFGIIASIIGLPISFLLTYYGIINNNPMGQIGYTGSIWPYVIGGIGIIVITLIAAAVPLRKLNDMNIVESLRIEE